MPWVAEAPHGGFSSATPWLPVPPGHLARAVDVEQRDAGSPLRFAQNILEWRRRQPQLLQGDITFFDAPEPVLAFRRDPRVSPPCWPPSTGHASGDVRLARCGAGGRPGGPWLAGQPASRPDHPAPAWRLVRHLA
jgi:glycosidase